MKIVAKRFGFEPQHIVATAREPNLARPAQADFVD